MARDGPPPGWPIAASGAAVLLACSLRCRIINGEPDFVCQACVFVSDLFGHHSADVLLKGGACFGMA